MKNIDQAHRFKYKNIDVGLTAYDSYLRYVGDSTINKITPDFIVIFAETLFGCDYFIDIFKKDKIAMNKLQNSKSIKDIDFTKFDIIFISGGWGAAYDLGYSQLLGIKISEAYYSSNAIIGGICHGVLGFINAKDKDGNLLISGRKMTGVTDKQIKELGITFTPQHPEEELRKAGVIFESKSAFRDMFATLTVVDDEKRFVTGQNQNSGHETAYQIMKLLDNN